jgi:hypothetical protein
VAIVVVPSSSRRLIGRSMERPFPRAGLFAYGENNLIGVRFAACFVAAV